ncbi:MAG TPA: SDR family oxidoreductase [Candidatus Acidoferrales bacterium]|nr:SDR family oxidoreductase [Candidatus Acidoferrales bacterium]
MANSYLEDLFRLDGKVSVVVGGSGVLGGSVAEAIAKAGSKVVIVYNHGKDAAEDRVKKIQKQGGEAMMVHADACVKKELESAKNEIASKWYTVDILVNAPGVNSPTPVLDIQEDEWERILKVNLKGIFFASQVFGKHMIDNKVKGSIINFSSASSEIPLSKVFTYGISKAGVNNMTRFLAREWAPYGIRVNAVMPGFFPAEQNRKILTEERRKSIFNHTPMARYGEADELSGAIIWLASNNASSFVTGTIIPVDGGFTAMTI